MDDRTFLHDNERLLCMMHPSSSVLIRSFFRGILDALLFTVILTLLLFILLSSAGMAMPWMASGILFVILYLLVCWKHYRGWSHAALRVTTDRILLQHHVSLFAHALTTVKWPQYQECLLPHRGLFDIFFGARPICIRYGAADGQLRTCFPSIAYAHDLKHYLDKVDSAVRSGQVKDVKPFVMKPRGQRD